MAAITSSLTSAFSSCWSAGVLYDGDDAGEGTGFRIIGGCEWYGCCRLQGSTVPARQLLLACSSTSSKAWCSALNSPTPDEFPFRVPVELCDVVVGSSSTEV
ncbi:hypothetical protein DQ04_10361030 [Trypanosoma grayi]|uniref:hypothetical protein n=1 Tax=Trypanosoma grayi TaxID=71804 RepID=UPI0004F4418E|nr:hypothetical protein DQ04_10361030 [Trypanosoma grayi]KEG07270.1 hypothetical protein DQ04_10361030 [Trypanosoma grayi]